MGDLEEAIKDVQENERVARRQKLFQILDAVLSGRLEVSNTPLAKIFNQSGPRKEYISPKDRGTFNSGYMDIGEMPINDGES